MYLLRVLVRGTQTQSSDWDWLGAVLMVVEVVLCCLVAKRSSLISHHVTCSWVFQGAHYVLCTRALFTVVNVQHIPTFAEYASQSQCRATPCPFDKTSHPLHGHEALYTFSSVLVCELPLLHGIAKGRETVLLLAMSFVVLFILMTETCTICQSPSLSLERLMARHWEHCTFAAACALEVFFSCTSGLE